MCFVTTPLHTVVYQLNKQWQPSWRCHSWKLCNHPFAIWWRFGVACTYWNFQRALDPFAAACNHAGMKISTKMTVVLRLLRNVSQSILQVSSNTLQQVEKFKYLRDENVLKEYQAKKLLWQTILQIWRCWNKWMQRQVIENDWKRYEWFTNRFWTWADWWKQLKTFEQKLLKSNFWVNGVRQWKFFPKPSLTYSPKI